MKKFILLGTFVLVAAIALPADSTWAKPGGGGGGRGAGCCSYAEEDPAPVVAESLASAAVVLRV